MRPYKMTKPLLNQIKKDFLEKLNKFDLSSTNFNFKYDVAFKEEQATTLNVLCSPTAYHKMQNLVKNTSSEIAWHMLVERINKNTLYISDVLVYPQTVTASTVTTDDIKYPTWLMELDDDTFNKLRGQGHSHVNMTTNPSGVDTGYYTDLLRTVKSGFYLFIILNKRNDMFIQVIDVDNNIVYENKDIVFEVASKTYNESSWYAEQMVNIETIKTVKFNNKSTILEQAEKKETEKKEYEQKHFGSIWDDFENQVQLHTYGGKHYGRPN